MVAARPWKVVAVGEVTSHFQTGDIPTWHGGCPTMERVVAAGEVTSHFPTRDIPTWHGLAGGGVIHFGIE